MNQTKFRPIYLAAFIISTTAVANTNEATTAPEIDTRNEVTDVRTTREEIVSDGEMANTKADNSRKNARDRDLYGTLTPIDQARGGRNDVETTRRIRSEIVHDSSLSTYAKNVKIITIDGVVTLRGPVRTDDERRKIASHVRKFVSPNMIVNRLEIAPAGNAR